MKSVHPLSTLASTILCTVLTTCGVLAIPAMAQTPTHHVAKTGCSDSNAGTSAAAPWCTVQKALTTVPAGSTVLVHAGTYYERITPTVSGSAGNLITLLGERGPSGERLTILDGSDLYTGGWTLNASTNGGLYRTTTAPYAIGWVGIEQGGQSYHILMSADYHVSRTLLSTLDHPAEEWTCVSYLVCQSSPPPLVKYWDAWEALATGDNPVYVRFRAGDNPAGKTMRVAPMWSATLKLQGVHHLTFKGLHVRAAYHPVLITSTTADIVLDDNELEHGKATIALYGPARITIKNNVIHGGRYPATYKPGPLNAQSLPAGNLTPGTWQYATVIAAHFNWFYKTQGFYDQMGIDTYYDEEHTPGVGTGVTDLEVSGNVITDYPAFGLTLADATNAKVFNNDVSHTSDCGLGHFGTLTNVQIYDNYLHDDAINIRFGPEQSKVQEVYIYRNRFDQPIYPGGKPTWGCCNDSGSGTHASTRRYWYHNSFLGGDREVMGYDGTLNWSTSDVLLNNVISGTQVFMWNFGGFNPGLRLFDYNWLGGQLGTVYTTPPRTGALVIGSHTIQATGQQMWTAKAWNTTTPTDFTLPASSPARHAGIDVTSPAAISLVGKALPGFTPGYFTGAAPHMGAVQDIVPTVNPHLAFPTAEGFGQYSLGGRGGKAYNVNSTASGPGTTKTCTTGGCTATTLTLQDCLLATEPRTCVFKVGGKFDAPCGSGGCVITSPYLTIAGQTAPGGGIMIASSASGPGQLTFRTNDVIVRHLRVRPGKAIATAAAIVLDTTASHDLIFDHVSTGWTPVDGVSFAHAEDVTWQWSILSEALGTSASVNAGCGVWRPEALPGTRGLSVLHSLVGNQWRNCWAHESGDVQWVNTVLYNIVEGGYVAATTTTPLRASYVGNYFKVGPQSNSGSFPNYPRVSALACSYGAWINCTATAGSLLYLSGNVHTVLRPSAASGAEDAMVLDYGTAPLVPRVTTAPAMPPLTTVVPATQVLSDTTTRAGAYAVADGVYSTVRRDTIDARAVSDVTNGTGNANVLDETTVGGYPSYAAGTAYTDTDGDGMADAWETAHGLNPNDASDGPALVVGGVNDGYSNLEVFLNELAGDGAATPVALVPVPVVHRLVR